MTEGHRGALLQAGDMVWHREVRDQRWRRAHPRHVRGSVIDHERIGCPEIARKPVEAAQLRTDGIGNEVWIAIDLERARNAVVGRDDDRVSALRCGEIAIDRRHLPGDVGPSHTVRKHFVNTIETCRVNSIWRGDRDDEQSEDGEFDHARDNGGDLKAGAELSTLDSGDRHQPLSHRDRNGPGRVVGLADEEEEEQRDGAGDSDRTQLSTAEQGDHARQPERKKEEEIDAELDEVSHGPTAAPPVVGEIGERGEALRHLPGQVRCPDEERDGGGDPRVFRPKVRPQGRRENHGDNDPGDQTSDGVLHLESDPERDAEVDPVPRPAVDDQAEEPVEGEHPGHLVEGHGLEDPVRAEQEGRRNGGEQRDSLEPQRAAKPADIGAGERDEETAQQRWQQAKGPRTDPEEPGLQSSKEWDEWWEVDISKRRMTAAIEVVELIGMEAQGATGGEMNGDDA